MSEVRHETLDCLLRWHLEQPGLGRQRNTGADQCHEALQLYDNNHGSIDLTITRVK